MAARVHLGIAAGSDPVRVARLLRRAHTIALETGVSPRIVRSVISDSWRRSIDAGVDPERPAPRMLDAKRTSERLAGHPIAPVLPRIRALLGQAMDESGCFVAFSDADGVLLWSEGPSRALRTAVSPRFLPGFLCREDSVGTNAIGTALVLDRPVQIFSAEHFNRLLHGWTCAASPVHHPLSGEVLGAIDLSGEFRTAHVHGVALVAAVAAAVEGWLATSLRLADQRLIDRYRQRCGAQRRPFSAVVTASGRLVHADPPGWIGGCVEMTNGATEWPQSDGTVICSERLEGGYLIWRAGRSRPRGARVTVAVANRARVLVTKDEFSVELNLRHSEIVVLLSTHPAGMTVRDLALALYGTDAPRATVRAEIARLRRSIGEDVVLSRPYRLHQRVRTDLRRGDARLLLPDSSAPGIVRARRGLDAAR